MLQNTNYNFEGLEPEPTLTDPRRFGIPEGAGEPISTITGKPLPKEFGKPEEKGLYNLEGLESDTPTWGEVLKKAPASGLASVNVGLARLARDTIKIADMPASAVREAFGIKGERPDVKFLEDYMIGEQKRQEVLDVSEKLSQLPHWHPKRIIGTGLLAVPQVAAVAGGALMGAPFIGGAESAATMLGAIAYGPSAEEAKSEGANEIQQILHGITSAQIEVLTELPVFRAVGQIWKHLKKAGIAKKAGVSFAKRLLTGLGLYGKGLALETTQEIEAYLGGQVSKKLHYDPNATINFKNAVEAGYGGLSMAATVGIAGIPGMAVKLAGKGKVRTTPEPTAEKPGIVNMIDEGMTTGEINGEPFTPEIATGIIQEAYADKALTSEDLDAFREKYPNLRPVVNDIIGENIKAEIDERVKSELASIEKIGKALTDEEIIAERAKILEEAPRRPAEVAAEVFEKELPIEPTPIEPTAEVAREPVGVEKKVVGAEKIEKVEVKEPWEMTKKEFSKATKLAIRDISTNKIYPAQKGELIHVDMIDRMVAKGISQEDTDAGFILPDGSWLSRWTGEKTRIGLPPKFPDKASHKFVVEKALKENKSVPAEVLAEYPDLKPLPPKPPKAKPPEAVTEEIKGEVIPEVKPKTLKKLAEAFIDGKITGNQDQIVANWVSSRKEGLSENELDKKIDSAIRNFEQTKQGVLRERARLPVKPKVEKEKVEVTPEIKKPWEITRDEYVKQYIEEQRAADFPEHMITDKYKESIMRDHFVVVSKAFAEDKAIPPEVLKDYPDLKAEEKVEVGITPEGKEITKLDLTKRYVKETGEKIEKGEVHKVKEKYPEEWAMIGKAEKHKKSLWDKLPEDFRRNRGINEYTPKELKDMVVWENLTLDEFEKIPLKERGQYPQLPKSVREERLETERWAEEQERKKKEEKAKLKAPIEAKTGIAWIKNVQKPILSARKITRGKNKGKYEIVLTKGRDVEGKVKPGLKRIVAKDAIAKMPIEKQFATKAIKPQDTITRADLKSIFAKMKNISTGVDKDGNFFFRPLGKPVVTILEVNEIEGYIDTSKGRIPVGSFLGNTIELKTGGEGHTADIGTAWHEYEHWMEANGILSNNDIKALDIALEKQGITPNTETRAEYVGDRLSEWQGQKNLRIRRVLKKIADFVATLYEFITRTRTAKGVLADIETGKILSEKELSAVNQFAQDVSFSLKKAAKAVTDNPNFVRWFGDSVVKDENSNPLVSYHGTAKADFSEFKLRKLADYVGQTEAAQEAFFFSSDAKTAEAFTRQKVPMTGAMQAIYPVYLSLQNPLIIDRAKFTLLDDINNGHNIRTKAIQRAKKRGNDGVIFKNMWDLSGNKTTSYAVFEPTQIKSIFNTGAFGITEPDIMFQMAGEKAIGAPEEAKQFATKPTKDYRAMLRRYQEAHTIVDKSLKDIPPQKPPKIPSEYEQGKDSWFGNKDWAEVRNAIERGKLQDIIRDTVSVKKNIFGKKIFDRKSRDVDAAIHLYLDLKRNPAHRAEFYEDLPGEWKRIVDKIDLIEATPELKAIADHIRNEGDITGKLALEADIIHNQIENHVNRVWKKRAGVSEKVYTDALQKFKTKSRHAKHRVFDTILEGLALKGKTGKHIFDLQIRGATSNLQTLKDEISRVIEDKKLITEMRKMKTEAGDPLLSTHRVNDTYIRVEHPNFKVWEFAAGIDLIEKEVDKSTRLSIGDSIRAKDRGNIGKIIAITDESVDVHFVNKKEGTEKTISFKKDAIGKLERPLIKVNPKGKNFFITDEGTVLEKRELYAPEKIARDLNKIMGVSRLKGVRVLGVPAIDILTKYNAIFKSWILVTSFFHHQAFLRSYYLPSQHKTRAEWNPFKAYKMGKEAIENMKPEVELLVRNGLTMFKMQDWEESVLRREDTIFGKILDKNTKSKAIKDKINELRERQANFLFGNFGAALKTQAALIELRNMTRKYPDMNVQERAKMVARLINDDFGGLHLGRMGRDPTIQHIMRLGLLAPDWTESNVRTMVKALRSPGGAEETAMYRRFWTSALTKGLAAIFVANVLMSAFDDDDFEKRYKKAWKAGHFRWLDIDITPVYKMLGGKSEAKKYFSLFGHFRDPLKFIRHPIRSLHHKGSVVYGTFHEAMSGVDWKGQRFTTLSELVGVDDKGVYLTDTKIHKKGDPKGGKLAGKLVIYGAKGPISLEQMPSYIASQLIGVQPIQVQNLIAMLTGEVAAFDGIARSLGMHTGTTYPTAKSIREDFIEEYISLKKERKSIAGLLKKVRKYNLKHKKETIKWQSIIKSANKKLEIERHGR